MKGLASRVHHRSPQFVKHHPCGLVTSKAKLALEEQRRDAPLVGGHQISGPEPQDQRGLRIASGTEPDIPGRPLRWRIQAETGEESQERTDAALPDTTAGRNLKQPDKQKCSSC